MIYILKHYYLFSTLVSYIFQDTPIERSATDATYDPTLDEIVPTLNDELPQYNPNQQQQPQFPEGFPQPPHPPPLPTVAGGDPENTIQQPHQPSTKGHGFQLHNVLPFLRPEPTPVRRTDDGSIPGTSSGYLPEFRPPSFITSGIKSISSVFQRLFRRRSGRRSVFRYF